LVTDTLSFGRSIAAAARKLPVQERLLLISGIVCQIVQDGGGPALLQELKDQPPATEALARLLEAENATTLQAFGVLLDLVALIASGMDQVEALGD
jgi:hypothetical protein